MTDKTYCVGPLVKCFLNFVMLCYIKRLGWVFHFFFILGVINAVFFVPTSSFSLHSLSLSSLSCDFHACLVTLRFSVGFILDVWIDPYKYLI